MGAIRQNGLHSSAIAKEKNNEEGKRDIISGGEKYLLYAKVEEKKKRMIMRRLFWSRGKTEKEGGIKFGREYFLRRRRR